MKTVIDVQNLIDQIVDLKIKLKEETKQKERWQESSNEWTSRATFQQQETFKRGKQNRDLEIENERLKARIAELEKQLTKNS